MIGILIFIGATIVVGAAQMALMRFIIYQVLKERAAKENKHE